MAPFDIVFTPFHQLADPPVPDLKLYEMASQLRGAGVDLTCERDCLLTLMRAGFAAHDCACLVYQAMHLARDSVVATEMARG